MALPGLGVHESDLATTARNQALLAVLIDKGVRRQDIVDLNLQDFVYTRK